MVAAAGGGGGGLAYTFVVLNFFMGYLMLDSPMGTMLALVI